MSRRYRQQAICVCRVAMSLHVAARRSAAAPGHNILSCYDHDVGRPVARTIGCGQLVDLLKHCGQRVTCAGVDEDAVVR